MRHTFSVLALAIAVPCQAPSVLSTSPAANTMHGCFEPITVHFSVAIDPATITPHSFSVFGRSTGVVPGALSVNAAGTSVTFQPLRPMFVGDAIRVDLAASITRPNGPALAGGHHFEFLVRTGPGSGTFQPTQTIGFRLPNEGRISTYGIHAGDVDRDGSPDITAINEYSHDLRTFRNDGCTTFGPMTSTADGNNQPSPHESADFNRDGWLDLATGDYAFGNVSVFLNNGAGTYLPPLSLPGGSYIRSVAAGDFNADGYPDLAVGNGGTTIVWLNNGSGGFGLPAVYAGNTSAEINVCDADEDGHLDIVGCSLFQGTTWVLIGNGDGTFTPNATQATIGSGPFASAAGDINGDGHVDIAYCCHSPDTLRWMLGDGAGGFVFGGTMPAGGGATSVHLGDLEGDGDLDAVLSHYFSADFYIYFNNGQGGFSAPVIFPAVSGAACTTLADFDRDGDLDIIGADEIVDVGILFTQTSTTAPGIQPSDCDATLRINQRADGAGYGGRPPVPVRAGTSAAFSLTGPPGGYPVLCLGFPAATSIPIYPWGLLGLDPTLPLEVLIGLIPSLDNNGELHFAWPTPAWLPLGYPLAVQALVFAPGMETLTNPMQFVAVP